MSSKNNFITRISKATPFLFLGSITLFSLAFSSLSLAQVPYSFTSGTPAVAAEMNANFSALETRISALESLNLPGIAVDCDADADALQTAVDNTPPKGANLLVTGACNNISIFDKNNLTIDGQGSTTILSTDDSAAINIAVSPLVFIKSLTADAASLADSAIIVGASTSIFSDVTAINGAANGDGTVSVWVNGVAIFEGNTTIGDGSDEIALTIAERGSVIVEGSASISGVMAIDANQNSFFDQDPNGAGDILTVNGDVSIQINSTFEINNGSIAGNIDTGSSSIFTATTDNGFDIALTGIVNIRGASGGSFITTDSTGTILITGAELNANFNSGFGVGGPGVTFEPDEVNLGWSGQLFFSDNASIDSNTTFNLARFSILTSLFPINPLQVNCNGQVVAETFDPYVNLCNPPEQ